ncbi:glycosyl hydrolase catalytic core-domain-containing protein [Roridomyces roridus]|uniref:Glycosyl hydrolase catalytic core-domain-containing protein n=1 Tax=Roridomyces roridus TaxID=1738132 RepID=A0AAD7CEZ6_9AGAR|nr:glycosyl hydrolase catalytic core-domain-containing protein [Roridomyces roridus]
MTFTTFILILLIRVQLLCHAHPATRTLAVTNASSKAGIAGGGDASTDMAQFLTTGKVSWYYTWGLSSVDDTDLDFVPMLWGQKDIEQWTDAQDGINATIAQRKPTAILGMNEPQEPGQSNLTAEQGAQMWITYIEPLRAQGLRLGSPAPSSAPSGKQWLLDFLTACNGGCTVDFIALHWYDVNATKFIDYLTDFHNTFQRPLWVTEWACQNFNKGPQCSADQVSSLLNTTQSFMNEQDWVERYAWYGVMRDLGGVNPLDAMMDGNGKITNLGEQYIGKEVPQTGGGGGTGGLPGVPTNAAGRLRALTSWAMSCLMLLVGVFLL